MCVFAVFQAFEQTYYALSIWKFSIEKTNILSFYKKNATTAPYTTLALCILRHGKGEENNLKLFQDLCEASLK